MTWRFVLSTVFELLGLGLTVFGVSLFSVPVALILGGLAVVLVGYAIDPPAPKDSGS